MGSPPLEAFPRVKLGPGGLAGEAREVWRSVVWSCLRVLQTSRAERSCITTYSPSCRPSCISVLQVPIPALRSCGNCLWSQACRGDGKGWQSLPNGVSGHGILHCKRQQDTFGLQVLFPEQGYGAAVLVGLLCVHLLGLAGSSCKSGDNPGFLMQEGLLGSTKGEVLQLSLATAACMAVVWLFSLRKAGEKEPSSRDGGQKEHLKAPSIAAKALPWGSSTASQTAGIWAR